MRFLKGLLGGLLALILVAVLLVVVFSVKQSFSLGKTESDFSRYASDVIGTKVATTTTGVSFRVAGGGGNSVTSSYVSLISERADKAVYTFKVLAASSTSNLRFDIQGSHDDFCNLAGVGTDPVAAADINWFSAGDHSPYKAQATTLVNASSTVTYVWSNPQVGTPQEVILENLTYRCLKLNISGSSTILWAQLRAE